MNNKTLQETEKTFDYSLENQENGVKKLVLNISPDIYADEFKNELKKAAKSVRLKGFRPGKVPTSYVKKLLGKKIISDLLSKLIEKSVDKAIREEENLLVGPFLTSPEDETKKLFNSLEPVGEIEFKYQIAENFNLEDYLNRLKDVEVPEVELSDKEKELVIKTAQYHLGKKIYTSSEALKEKDVFWAFFRPASVEKNKEIPPLPEQEEDTDETTKDAFEGIPAYEKITLPVLIIKEDFPELYEQIVQGKFGETEIELPVNDEKFPFYIVSTRESARLIAELLKENKAVVEFARKAVFKPISDTVKKIKEIDSHTEKSEEELQKEIEEDIVKNFRDYITVLIKNQVIGEWNKRVKEIASEISLTEEMLKLEAEKHKDHHHENEQEIAEEVTRQFVVKKLQDKYPELQINEKEILEKTREYLASMFRVPHLDDTTLMELLKKYPFIYNQVLEETYIEQLFEFIKNNFAEFQTYNYYDFFRKFIVKPYENEQE